MSNPVSNPVRFRSPMAIAARFAIVLVFVLLAIFVDSQQARAIFVFFSLILLAVPIWVVLGIVSVMLLNMTDAIGLPLIGESLFDGLDAFSLIAIPLFILTGDVLVRAGLSDKLLDVASATVGGLKAGMGSATVLGCGLFACISGSDAADAAAISRVTYSRLLEKGYPPSYASALIAAGACTGILIPPSIAYIVIGLVLGISASTLFTAAIIPGIVILLTIMITNIIVNQVEGYESSTGGFRFRTWVSAMWDGKWALMIPVILLGGIYAGIFTPAEAAAVAVLVSIIVGMFQKTLTLSDFPKMLENSAKINGVILPIIAFSLPLAQALAVLGIPQAFVAFMTSITTNPVLLTLVMIGILIIAGCFLETTPNIVILAPILLPLATDVIGMDPVHFCITMVTALGVGFITPPLGLNIFVVSSITKVPIMPIAGRAIPFVLSMLIAVLIIAFIPQLSMVFVR